VTAASTPAPRPCSRLQMNTNLETTVSAFANSTVIRMFMSGGGLDAAGLAVADHPGRVRRHGDGQVRPSGAAARAAAEGDEDGHGHAAPVAGAVGVQVGLGVVAAAMLEAEDPQRHVAPAVFAYGADVRRSLTGAGHGWRA